MKTHGFCFRLIACVAFTLLTLPLSAMGGEKPAPTGKAPWTEGTVKGVFTILPGQTLNESLSSQDSQFQDGTYYDQYNLNWPGGDLTITYTTAAFDAYLVVFAPPGFPSGTRTDVDNTASGAEVFQLNSAPAGNYTIWANSYAPATGAYSISVSQSTVCPTPTPPASPSPAHQATGVATDVNLSWSAKSNPKVIYGTDDRQDMYQVTDPALVELARSTVVLVDLADLTSNQDGTFSIPSLSFTNYIQQSNGLPLCADEPYRQQPVPGNCSGFLVAPNLVATAGHCITNQSSCVGKVFIFGFEMLDANTPKLTFQASDIYYCDGIVDRVLTNDGSDWAVIRLDRNVVGRNPLPIRRSGKIADDQSLFIIGHPVGLPKKVAGNAKVRTNSSASFFSANLDSYAGNSGSAVFNAQTLEVEGVLVRGNTDFQVNGNCYQSIRCTDSGCQGEDCTRTTEFANLIPQTQSNTYTVFFGPCGNLSQLGTTQSTSWDLPVLNPGTQYCWQIRVQNSCGSITDGPVWSFTTAGAPTPTHTPTATATPSPSPTTPGVTPVPTAFNPEADIDGDGVINADDMLLLLRNWQRRVGN